MQEQPSAGANNKNGALNSALAVAATPAVAAGGLARGAGTALAGMKRALGNKDVRGAYVQLLIVLYIMTVVVAVGTITLLWWLTPIAADASWWMAAILWTARVAGSAILAFASPLIALFSVNIVFPLLGERVFFAGLRGQDPARAEALEGQEGMPTVRATWMSVKRLLLFLRGTVLTFLLTLIPVAGALIGPLVQLWLTSRAMTWELLDPWFDKRQMYLPAQREFVGKHGSSMVGFGLPFTLLLSLPFVGPLFFGLAQAAVASLLTDVLEPQGSDPRTLPSA